MTTKEKKRESFTPANTYYETNYRKINLVIRPREGGRVLPGEITGI